MTVFSALYYVLILILSMVYFKGMLKETEQKKDSAVKCLDVLSTSKPGHWKAILEAGRSHTSYY